MSNLVEHAKEELSRLGNGPDYDEKVIEMIKAFSEMGHSGGSAFYTISLVQDLLLFKNLTDLTNAHDEWNQVEMDYINGRDAWQSRRRADAFTFDPGKRFYYTLSDHGALNYQEFQKRMHDDKNLRDDTVRLFRTKVEDKS